MPKPDAVRTKVLLKARPTPVQIADRLAAPFPEGLELYLAPADISGSDYLGRTVEALGRERFPDGFEIVVEGPVRSLDGSFFDLSRDTPEARETIRRVVEMGRALGAGAANVHLIAPVPHVELVGWEHRPEVLRSCLPLASFYAETCQSVGVLPLVENMPPVLRQRESAFWYTPVGMAVDDLLWLAERVPGMGLTVDLSHAQLYLNARRLATADAPTELAELVEALRREQPPLDARIDAPAETLANYLSAALPYLVNVHVSNASGLLGEGLPYDEGDVDLDAVVALAVGRAAYLVTETLDPNPDQAVQMRDAQRRLTALRDRVASGR